MRSYFHHNWKVTGAGLLLTLISLVLYLPSFGYPGSRQDEALLLVCPEQILNGAIPHRDFQSLYGPGGYWLLAAAYHFFGVSVYVERVIAIFFRIAIVLGLFSLTCRYGLKLAVTTGLLAAMMLVPLLPGAQIWQGALPIALWSLWLASHSNAAREEGAAARNLFGAGFLAGLAILFRLDIAFSVLISAVPLLHLASRKNRLIYLGGLAVGWVPLFVHLMTATPAAVYDNIIGDAKRTGGGRYLPIPPPSFQGQMLLGLLLVGVAAALVAGIWASRRSPVDPGGRSLLSLGLLSLGCLPYALFRADNSHLLKVACVAVSLLPVSLTTLLTLFPHRLRSSSLQGVPIALVSFVFFITQWDAVTFPVLQNARRGLGRKNYETFVLAHRGRAFLLDSAKDVADASMTLDAVEQMTHPGDRLFVGPKDLRRTNYNDTFLYYFLPQLKPSAYYFEMDPGMANRPGSRLATDVATADVLILTDRYDQWNEPNTSRLFGSDRPSEVVREQFVLRWNQGPFEVYLRQK